MYERRYSSTILDLLTRWRWWSVSNPGRFAPGKEPPIRIGQEAGWVPWEVWILWSKEKFLDLPGIEALCRTHSPSLYQLSSLGSLKDQHRNYDIMMMIIIIIFIRKWHRVVDIETGYGLEDRRVGIRVPVGSRIFSFPRHPDQLCGPPKLLSDGYLGLFPRV
jgi:hypothetical protein